jgi:hypothetical protein
MHELKFKLPVAPALFTIKASEMQSVDVLNQTATRNFENVSGIVPVYIKKFYIFHFENKRYEYLKQAQIKTSQQ